MTILLQDLRYACRMLRRTPGFTLIAILTLALGIGATTAIFTVVHGLLLKPLPYAAPDRLVMVWQDLRAQGGPADEWASPGNYVDWRGRTDLFAGVAAIGGWRPILAQDTEPEAIPGQQVTHEHFGVLGVPPVLGRDFRAEDDQPHAPRVAIISDPLWKRRFAGDPGVIGRTVTFSGEPHAIIGVLPPGFHPVVADDAQIWRPSRMDRATPNRGLVILRVVARLKDGLPLDRAQAGMSAFAKQLETVHPEYNAKVGFVLQPLHDRVVGAIRPGLLALFGAVAAVLLIACANIANLLLARGSGRGREFAVRRALGAGRGRVVRQLLTESLLLAVIGGGAGLLLAVWIVPALVALAPAQAPRLTEIAMNGPVFAFATLVTVASGLLFGLAPALRSSRTDVTLAMKEGARGASSTGGRALRRGLTVAEVALALMLLTVGGLLLQTFVRLQHTDLGFTPDRVLVGAVNPPRVTYDTPARQLAFFDQLLEKASALPGVERAALSSVVPLGGDSDVSFSIEGRPAAHGTISAPVTWFRQVSASYFDVMGMTMRRGQPFRAREAAPSAIVNETMAAKYFAGEDPIGRRIRFDDNGPWFTIVALVRDAKVHGARESTRAETFVPYWQMPSGGMSVMLKTAAADPESLAQPLRQAVSSVDRGVPTTDVAALATLVSESIDQPRFLATLAVAFAALALLLAALGIYGVMAYAVTQRTMEIGVRMALGATTGEVFRLIAGDGLKLAAAGVAIGLGGSLLVARSLTTLLFGVAPGDPLTLAATAGTLLLVAAAACLVPARRATRVDPMIALRND